jgi:manganese transport protein
VLSPRLDAASVYVAVAILGAAVMPHNLYLHSSLVQTRAAPSTSKAKRRALALQRRRRNASRYNAGLRSGR